MRRCSVIFIALLLLISIQAFTFPVQKVMETSIEITNVDVVLELAADDRLKIQSGEVFKVNFTGFRPVNRKRAPECSFSIRNSKFEALSLDKVSISNGDVYSSFDGEVYNLVNKASAYGAYYQLDKNSILVLSCTVGIKKSKVMTMEDINRALKGVAVVKSL